MKKQTCEQKKIIQKDDKEKQSKFRKLDCIRCGAPNRNKMHDCPVRTKNLWIVEQLDTAEGYANQNIEESEN